MRRALIRAVCRAAIVGTGAAPFALCTCLASPFTVPFLGAVAFAVAIVETFALERARSRKARIGFALLIWIVAVIGVVGAHFQGVYLRSVIATGSLAAALESVRTELGVLIGTVPPGKFGRDFTLQDVALTRIAFFPSWLGPALALVSHQRLTARATAEKAFDGAFLVAAMSLLHALTFVTFMAVSKNTRHSDATAAFWSWAVGSTAFLAAMSAFGAVFAGWYVERLTDAADSLERRMCGPEV